MWDTLDRNIFEVDMKYTSVSYLNIHPFLLYNVGILVSQDSKYLYKMHVC